MSPQDAINHILQFLAALLLGGVLGFIAIFLIALPLQVVRSVFAQAVILLSALIAGLTVFTKMFLYIMSSDPTPFLTPDPSMFPVEYYKTRPDPAGEIVRAGNEPYIYGRIAAINIGEIIPSSSYFSVEKDSTADKIDKIQREVPAELLPMHQEDIGTLLLLDWRRSLEGSYQDGSPAYRVSCTVTIVDLSRQLIVDRKSFVGEPSPRAIKSGEQSGYGPAPIDNVVKYIAGLPRRELVTTSERPARAYSGPLPADGDSRTTATTPTQAPTSRVEGAR